MFSVLIVCSDDRATEIAKVLGSTLTIYRRRNESNSWNYSLWNKDEWRGLLSSETPPQTFDVLFVHLGQGDLGGIPAGVSFKKEFSFSEPGLGEMSPPERLVSFPIQRPFPVGRCPISVQDVDELKDFVLHGGSELPRFCLPEPPIPVTDTLCLLCQGYLAVHASANQGLEKMSTSLERMGWSEIPAAEKPALAGRIKNRVTEVESPAWWRDKLLGRSTSATSPGEEAEKLLKAKLVAEWALESSDQIPVALGSLIKAVSSHAPLANPELVDGAFRELISGKRL